MCMLSYLPPGVQPNEDELFFGAAVNPDGHGWAIVNANRSQITIRKSMSADEALDTFVKERDSNDSGPALFHSRIGTSGKIDITGVHPFHVGNDRRTLVAHNGVLFDPGEQSAMSDTAIFAAWILPKYKNLDKPKTFGALERYAGFWNKLVVLTVNPRFRKNAYLVNEDAGHWSAISGIWHSTLDYLPYTKPRLTSGEWWVKSSSSTLWSGECEREPSKYDKPGDGELSPWPCELCGSFNTVDMVTMVCSMCRTCNDCKMFVENCQCYSPGRHYEPLALARTDQPLAIMGPKATS